MASLKDQLTAIDAQIESNLAQAASLRSGASEWISQSKVACNQASKKKKAECQADKQMKADKGNAAIAQAVSLENTSELVKSKEGIQKLIDAEALSQVKLAEQGKDKESLRIVAEGVATADKITAQNISTAQAEATLRTADADAKNSEATNKSKNLIFIIIGVVVALGLGVVIFLKVKKGKGKKSKSKR